MGEPYAHMDAKEPSNFAKILAESPLYDKTMNQNQHVKYVSKLLEEGYILYGTPRQVILVDFDKILAA